MRTKASDHDGKYAFITSTPQYSASKKKETRTLVRKHVMRPFMKQNHPKRVNGYLKVLAPRETSTPSDADTGVSHVHHQYVHNDGVVQARQEEQDFGDVDAYDNGQGSCWANGFGGDGYGYATGNEYAEDASMVSQISSTILLGSGRANPFQSYPITMDVQDHELVNHIWKPNQVNFQPFRDFWYPLGLADDAGMLLVLSNAAVHLRALRGNRAEDTGAIVYHLNAVKSVNRRLESFTPETSDGILGAILGFMCHDQILSNYTSFHVHLAGFRRILALRGGLSSIENSRPLRLSLFWIEHNMASDMDVPPAYSPPYHLLMEPYTPLYQEEGERHLAIVLANPYVSRFMSTQMLEIMRDLSVLSVAISHESQKSDIWRNQNFAGLCIYPILSRLLTIQPHVQNNTEELFRLGAILYIAGLRRKFGVAPVLTVAYVSKLQVLLDDKAADVVWMGETCKLRRWVLVLAACMAHSLVRHAWVVERMLGEFGVCSWDEIEEEMRKMWWCAEVLGTEIEQMKISFSLQ